jgi:glycerate dehydrogenase
MGIVGFSRIGRHVAEIAVAMGMHVIASDAAREDTPGWPGFRWCELDDLLAAADVASLHCPLLPETHGIINAASLSKDEAGWISYQHFAWTTYRRAGLGRCIQ